MHAAAVAQGSNGNQLLLVMGNTTAAAAERISRANNYRVTNPGGDFQTPLPVIRTPRSPHKADRFGPLPPLKSSLSSAMRMVSALVPIISTWCSRRKPDSSSSTARFRAFCRPAWAKMLSGVFFQDDLFNRFRCQGSIYTLSAISRSVMIVAGLELRMTSTPSSRSARRPACQHSRTLQPDQ